jgi:hypothetical protein
MSTRISRHSANKPKPKTKNIQSPLSAARRNNTTQKFAQRRELFQEQHLQAVKNQQYEGIGRHRLEAEGIKRYHLGAENTRRAHLEGIESHHLEANGIRKHHLESKQNSYTLSLLKKKVNPGNIGDGHCAMCAFNTYVALKGYNPVEAAEPRETNSVTFGRWFEPIYGMFRGPGVILATINNNQNENKIVFKNRVIREILQVTQNKDAVLISVDDSHWYAAFNRDGRIVFVDSQTGKGLMYIDQPYHHTLFLKIHKFL